MLFRSREGYTVSWIVPNALKNEMEPIILDIKPKQSSFIMEPHEGEEFGYVLEGRVILVYGDQTITVRKGQNFYIRGDKEHYLKNEGSYSAKVLWISTPPLF